MDAKHTEMCFPELVGSRTTHTATENPLVEPTTADVTFLVIEANKTPRKFFN